jgi:hypothetical protein
MRTTGSRLVCVAALPALIVAALSMSSHTAGANAVSFRASGTVITSFSRQPDPCGSNRYGCYAPYGACDSYKPGCAGPYDPGYKPYDYDQNKSKYG